MYLEFRFIGIGKKTFSKYLKFPLNHHSLSKDKITSLHEQGYNIFFGVNPRPPSKQKTQQDIRDIICLWLDIDSKNIEGGKEIAKKRINEFLLPPNIIVDSGNGFHCYWMISDNHITRTTTNKIPAFFWGLVDYPGQGGLDGNRSTSEEINGT